MKKYYLFQGTEEHHFNSLENQQLYFGYAKSFNDPYDCNIQIIDDHTGKTHSDQGHSWEELKTLFKKNYSETDGNPHWDAYLLPPETATHIQNFCDNKLSSNELCRLLRNHIRERLGIRCLFADKPESTLMWAHYANQHRGFCIELEQTTNKAKRPSEINYANHPPYIYLSEILFSSRNAINSIYKYKHTCWSYENELRIMDYNYYKKHQEAGNGNGFLVNVPDYGYSISAVILGASISTDHEKRITDFCSRQRIQLCKATPYDQSAYRRHDKLLIEPPLT